MSEMLCSLGRWLMLVLAALLTGLVFGQTLDAVLRYVSHDYIFPYGYYRERGIQSGALLGMIAGTTLHWLHCRCAWPQLLGSWLAAVLIIVALTLASGAIAALAAKVAPAQTVGTVMTTAARHAFCWGIVWGAKWSCLPALVAFVFFVKGGISPEGCENEPRSPISMDSQK